GTTITLDMLIGEEDYLGKSLSNVVIREFLLSEFPEVEEVLIDPEASNSRAVHVYEKVGFTILGEFIPSHSPHPHYMMRLIMNELMKVHFCEIIIRPYQQEDAQDLANIYYHTIRRVNIQDYSQKQVEAWAPTSSLGKEGWIKKFETIKPFVAVVDRQIVGFAEFESNGHIGCFFCHHEWIGKGVGSALMHAINTRAIQKKINRIFTEVSVTAKPFFEKQGFIVIREHVDIKRGVDLVCYKMEKTLELSKKIEGENIRCSQYEYINKCLNHLSNDEITTLLEQGDSLHSGYGTSVKIEIDGIPLFVKQVPLNEVEGKLENIKSTKNLFEIPLYYQYGVGSGGFNIWREVYAHNMSTDWVLKEESENFPLMYHWRILDNSKEKNLWTKKS
ncbi:GNAT family N-acetyltransferase, partial [Chlamydiales bacterium]|nr:GNAT family N-acetyltransferase [Chlamydiales bacterium]